jgi:hypothetical protein
MVVKLLKQSTKQGLHNQGINPHTRRGNKELHLLINQVAQAPFDSKAEVQAAGTSLAERIVELSQQQGKQNLDAGVVRKLTLSGSWQPLSGIPQSQPPAEIDQPSAPEPAREPANAEATPVVDQTNSEVESAEEVPASVEVVDAESLLVETAMLMLDTNESPVAIAAKPEFVTADDDQPESIQADDSTESLPEPFQEASAATAIITALDQSET